MVRLPGANPACRATTSIFLPLLSAAVIGPRRIEWVLICRPDFLALGVLALPGSSGFGAAVAVDSAAFDLLGFFGCTGFSGSGLRWAAIACASRIRDRLM